MSGSFCLLALVIIIWFVPRLTRCIFNGGIPPIFVPPPPPRINICWIGTPPALLSFQLLTYAVSTSHVMHFLCLNISINQSLFTLKMFSRGFHARQICSRFIVHLLTSFLNLRVTEPDRTCLKVWMLSRWVRDYITTTETSQYSLCCGLKKRRLTSLQTVTLWHGGLIVSRRLYFIKWREGGSLVTPTIFPCWYVWSQQDFGVTQAWTLTLTQVKAWFHGVLWHWTMSHLCPVQSVSAVRAEAISRAGTTERY